MLDVENQGSDEILVEGWGGEEWKDIFEQDTRGRKVRELETSMSVQSSLTIIKSDTSLV